MAGSKTANKNKGIKGAARERFVRGTDEPVIRIMMGGGKRRFVWGVKDPSGGHRIVPVGETELR